MTIEELSHYIDASVLAWLATVDNYGQPSVSPKEIFCLSQDRKKILIANIASPNSRNNIKHNSKVCLSLVDVLVQKGCKVYGNAKVVEESDSEYAELHKPLYEMAGDTFPFKSIFVITIESVKPILAPRYILYPETQEADQIASAKEMYGLSES